MKDLRKLLAHTITIQSLKKTEQPTEPSAKEEPSQPTMTNGSTDGKDTAESPQESVTGLHIVQVGAGGIGTKLADGVVRRLQKQETSSLVIVDGDTIEPSNLTRQEFTPIQVGMPKAEALCQGLQEKYPEAELDIGFVHKYVGEEFIKENFNGGKVDLVLLAVDSDVTRKFFIESYDGWIISGQNDYQDGSTFIWHPELNPNPTKSPIPVYVELGESGVDRSKMSCQEISNLEGGEQLNFANFMAAGWMLAALEALVGNIPLEWNFVFFNLQTGEASSSWRGVDVRPNLLQPLRSRPDLPDTEVEAPAEAAAAE